MPKVNIESLLLCGGMWYMNVAKRLVKTACLVNQFRTASPVDHFHLYLHQRSNAPSPPPRGPTRIQAETARRGLASRFLQSILVVFVFQRRRLRVSHRQPGARLCQGNISVRA